MDIVKTKAASELLGVSQTTIKRWASHFSESFHKDHLGHYVFAEEQISLLLYIKDRIDQGDSLDQITLPAETPSSSEPQMTFNTTEIPLNDMLSRLREVERSLEQKADEVVCAQVLQHRVELEELRRSFAQLAASFDTLQKPMPKPFSTPKYNYPISSDPPPPRVRKKRFFFF
jgi:chromosome-anchoring protein RacA